MNAWQKIQNYLKTKVNTQSYQTWLRPTRLSHAAEDTLYVRVPNREFEEWIGEKYGSLIVEALEKLQLSYHQVAYVFEESAEGKAPENGEAKAVQGKLDFESAECPLDPRFTFDSFVVGACNQFARAAALAVAETPAKAYNPLFLYGGVGLGKTHLMQAVGHKIRKEWKEMRLAYVSSEHFTNEFITSVRYDRMVSFRDKYRKVDVLLVDDIQFIAGKERSQEEFFHTFNTLYETQRQLVISSDCSPREIREIDLEARRVSIENIQRVVCEEFKLSVSQLKAKNNSRAVAHPRQVAMYLAKELTTASLPQIGREFGGKHHTTALHAINKIREMRKSDRILDRLIHKLTDSLNCT